MHLIETAGQIALNFIFFYDKTLEKLEELKKQQDTESARPVNHHRTPPNRRRGGMQTRQQIQEEETGANELEKALGGADAEFEIRSQALKVLLEKGLLEGQILGIVLDLVVDYILPFVPDYRDEIDGQVKKTKEDESVFLPKNYVHTEKILENGDEEGDETEAEESQRTGNDESLESLGLDPPNATERASRPSVGLRSSRRREPKRHSERKFLTHNTEDLQMCLLKTCVSCLVKIMVLNEKCCEQYLDLVFKILWSPQIACDIKELIILALGDSLYRHSTILNEKKERIFKFLRFRNIHLRELSLVVLSQLVLSDYLKIKNETIDFVLLLSDESPKIVKGVRHFFRELKKKDPRIFSNLIPEAITRFSQMQDVEATTANSKKPRLCPR